LFKQLNTTWRDTPRKLNTCGRLQEEKFGKSTTTRQYSHFPKWKASPSLTSAAYRSRLFSIQSAENWWKRDVCSCATHLPRSTIPYNAIWSYCWQRRMLKILLPFWKD